MAVAAFAPGARRVLFVVLFGAGVEVHSVVLVLCRLVVEVVIVVIVVGIPNDVFKAALTIKVDALHVFTKKPTDFLFLRFPEILGVGFVVIVVVVGYVVVGIVVVKVTIQIQDTGCDDHPPSFTDSGTFLYSVRQLLWLWLWL